MKVFISWSGSPSKDIAEVFAKYIPDTLQFLKANKISCTQLGFNCLFKSHFLKMFSSFYKE